MSNPADTPTLSPPQRDLLLQVAVDSIRHGVMHGRPLPLDATRFVPALQEKRATFVTLQYEGRLRGCIGMLQAVRPLVIDVAENAFAAAFNDPRFPPVSIYESQRLEVHISILTPATPLSVRDEADLLSQLRPGIDGLILEETAGGLGRGRRHATFLPAVWAQLPQPAEFLQHLKAKAGLPPDHWSDTLRFSRYSVDEIP